MEPQIQYAKTSDGVSIAYCVLGEGPPLVFASQIWGSLHMAQAGINGFGYWSMDDLLAAGRTVALYDARGTGSSDRGVPDYSLQARVRDLEAVVQSAGFASFPLAGFGHGASTAIAYAVDHSDVVEQLLLVNPFVSGAEYYKSQPPMRALKAMQDMAEEDFEYLTRSLASGLTGFDDIEESEKLAKAFQAGMRPSDMVAFREAAEAINIGDLLPQVTIPTIVIRDDSVRIGNELTRALAAGIPGAQFIVTSDYKSAVNELLGTRSATPSTTRRDGGTAVILFADIVDSTALTEQLGDAAFRGRARELDTSLRTLIREHDGTPIEGKLLGDGVLAVFTSARQAIEAAQRCAAAGDSCALPLHLGVHAGDVIREENNVYGGAVNIASRIADASAPGEVLVSQTVRDLARTSAGVAFEDRGERALKGVAEPIRVWAVRQSG